MSVKDDNADLSPHAQQELLEAGNLQAMPTSSSTLFPPTLQGAWRDVMDFARAHEPHIAHASEPLPRFRFAAPSCRTPPAQVD